jgi:hypothetical protein
MKRRPNLEVYCLADSAEGVRHLAQGLKESGARRAVGLA